MTLLQHIIDFSLAGGLLALALCALTARNLNRCVVFFMTFGLLMAFTWARLSATDVALVEIAIGSGLTGAVTLT